MIKFAMSKYGMFSNNKTGLAVRKNEVFAVTKEIEASKSYQDGVATRNFIPVTIKNTYELSKVVNLTDAIRAEFLATLPKPVVDEPVVTILEPVEVVPEVIPEPEPEKVPEPEVLPEEPKEPEKVLSFTEEAGSVKMALPLIEIETDIKKLKLALKLDERVSIKKAIHKRIEELKV